MRLAVPDLVRQRALSYGSAGQEWLEELPNQLSQLSTRWGLTLGEPLAGGTAAYVTAAVDRSGNHRVVKVAMQLDADEIASFNHSIEAHRAAAGRGCVAMIAHDADAQAVLLERLGPSLDELGLEVSAMLKIIANTLNTFWRPAPTSHHFPTGADKATWLIDFIRTTWEQLDRPCDVAVIDRAIACCSERQDAFDPASAILVHGDAHGWNTLDAGGGAYKFVDPEGLVSERAHDLAVPMREYNEPLAAGDTHKLVRERAEILSAWCDVDPEPIWQWGFIERVSTGLANLRDFDDDSGQLFLHVAERSLT